MKKIDINNMMLFKLRDNRICVLMPRENGNCLYDIKSIESGYYGGVIDINSYLENLTDSNYSYNHYDIVAIKQFKSMNEVLHHVLNNIEPKEWDWVREERKEIKSHRRELIDIYNGKNYGIEGKITPFTYNNQTLHVGDIIKIKSSFETKAFVCYDDGDYFIMGIKGSCDNNGNILNGWNITGIIKKYYDVEDNEICEDLRMINNKIKSVKLPLCIKTIMR